MGHPVADERATPRENTGIVEYRLVVRRNRADGEHVPRVEVDEVGVASRKTVVRDTVRIVACRTRGTGREMAAVPAFIRQDRFPETDVVQDARPVVAAVTKCVGHGTLGGPVGRLVSIPQYRGIGRAVWSSRDPSVIAVTVGAIDDAACGEGGLERRRDARDVGVLPDPDDRMIGGIRRGEFETGVGTVDDPRNVGGSGRQVGVALETDFVLVHRRTH